MTAKGDPDAEVVQEQIAVLLEIVTAPEFPQEEIGVPANLNVTVPLCPAPVVAVKVTTDPASRGDAGDALREIVESCFESENEADLLAEYQFASPAFCATIAQVPVDF